MGKSKNERGIGAMLLAVGMFAFMDTGLKLLSPHYPAMQVAAMRALSSLPLVIAYVAWRGAFGSLVRVRWSLHLFRGVLGIGMLSMFAFGLRDLPHSISAVTVRIVGRTDSSESQVFWLMTMVGVGAGIFAAPGWVAIRPEDAWVLLGVAVTGFFGQLFITEAFRHGEASAIAPLEYSALAWAVGLDWLLWKTLPDEITLLGAAIIIASGIYLVRRERVHMEAEHP